MCVTGASGYIASWLIKHLLQRGYTVKATVRDTSQCLSLSLSLSLQFVSACKWHVLSLNKIYLNLLILLEFLSFLINFVKKLPLKKYFPKKICNNKNIYIDFLCDNFFFHFNCIFNLKIFFFNKCNWMKGLN